ncbi:YbaN family protein [Vibrio fluvialis]|uniref:YbaN family protein n=1 Tax=Vibrio fluvialis TaxID=676 RepID=UPI001F3415B7|nr:YbaN family protein [Vibrio fluvialis]MCE7611082.1 YbaN family protein [Vibrio fluvialis]MCE7619350.1 YbaN family protein [Vibrio fluvialis]MCE7628257.1 YbaN family protein [Vibrio fluvialis]
MLVSEITRHLKQRRDCSKPKPKKQSNQRKFSQHLDIWLNRFDTVYNAMKIIGFTLLMNRIKRKGYQCVGITCVILGAIGATVPLLPTVPFLLLALYCFGVSSPRFQQWLLQHQRLGPLARRLHHKQGFTRAEKWQSLTVIWLSMGCVWYFMAQNTHWQYAIAALLLFETWFILRLKTYIVPNHPTKKAP